MLALVLAVLYFDNHTGQPAYDPLEKGLADMMVTDLAGTPGVTVVERARLESLIAELKLQEGAFFDPTTAQALGRGAGATYALTGAITAVAPQLRLDVRLIEIATGEVKMARKIVGDPQRFFELEEQLVRELLRALGVAAEAGAHGPRDLATAMIYSRAIDSADRGDYAAAAERMGELLQLEPELQVAKDKYGEFAARLRSAGDGREAALARARTDLLKRMEERIGKYQRPRGRGELDFHVCALALQGNLALLELEVLIGRMTLRKPKPGEIVLAPKRQRGEVERLHRAYFEQLGRMHAFGAMHRKELASTKETVDCFFEREERSLAEQVGVVVPSRLYFSEEAIGRAESGYLIFGRPPAFTGYTFTVWPSLAQRDEKLRARALAQIEALRPKDDPKRAASWVDLWARSLLMFGRTQDAIESWQQYLEQYPAAPDYARVEADIQRALGIDANTRAFRAALSTCDRALVERLEDEALRRGWAESSRGLEPLVRSVEAACAKAAHREDAVRAAYFGAAKEAVFRGDCELYRSFTERRPDLASGHPEDAVAFEDACR